MTGRNSTVMCLMPNPSHTQCGGNGPVQINFSRDKIWLLKCTRHFLANLGVNGGFEYAMATGANRESDVIALITEAL